jgi:hypothetical protein
MSPHPKFVIPEKELIEDINKDLPINIKKLEVIVNRIHEKYPLLDKSDVAIVVKTIFETMRELLIKNHEISVNNFFKSMKFYYFTHCRQGHIIPALKIKINTSPKLRKYVRR